MSLLKPVIVPLLLCALCFAPKPAKAEVITGLALSIGGSIAGKFLYDLLFEDLAHNMAARRSGDIRDQHCAKMFKTYDPGSGLYRTKEGKKKLCPLLLKD